MMRSIPAALALALLSAVSSADASTFVMMDETALTQRSVAAVRGTVTAIEAVRDPGTDGVLTYVHLRVDEALFGDLPPGEIVLREIGGRLGGLTERVFGSPEYRLGEPVLVFVAGAPDGTVHTTGMAMGKFSLTGAADGAVRAVRRLGEGSAVWEPRSGRLIQQPGAEEYDFEALRRNVQAAARRSSGKSAQSAVPRWTTPGAGRQVTDLARREFTFLNSPSRWFEPDQGLPITYRIDVNGDAGLGPATSRAAVLDAFDAWTAVATSALALGDGGNLSTPIAFAGCSGGNRIVFNDPFGEVTDPSGCGGILAIGGYCSSTERRTVNGTSFRRITLGKVTFNNGWTGCQLWTQCNLAEVVTHELGHTVGFGHSTERAATMYGTASFDGRCAGLHADDVAAATFTYPNASAPSPTPSATPPPPTASHTATSRPPSATPTPSPTPPTHRVAGAVRYYANDLGVRDVTVRLQSDHPASTITSATGTYDFDAVVDDGGTLLAEKQGDTESAVSALDAAYVLQHIAQLRQLDDHQRLACDVTGNGTLSPLDAVSILRLIAGIPGQFPVAERCASEWIFVPDAASLPATSIIQPTVTSTACSSGRIALAALSGDVLAQDFRAAVFGDCTGNWQPPGGTSPATTARRRTPLVRLGSATIRRGIARLPVFVHGPRAFSAVDLRLHYDAAHLTPVGVRLRAAADGAIYTWHTPSPGEVRIALARGKPLQLQRGALLLVEFELVGTLGNDDVRLAAAQVDERPATVAGLPSG